MKEARKIDTNLFGTFIIFYDSNGNFPISLVFFNLFMVMNLIIVVATPLYMIS